MIRMGSWIEASVLVELVVVCVVLSVQYTALVLGDLLRSILQCEGLIHTLDGLLAAF